MAFSAPTIADGEGCGDIRSALNIAFGSIETELDGKKDDFTENTAFNKNFGTGSENVPRGNSVVLLTGTQTIAGDKTFSGSVSAANLGQLIKGLERSADPTKPGEGEFVVWMSDGTGLGDDGDVIIASTAGGVTNYSVLFDHSGGTVWS